MVKFAILFPEVPPDVEIVIDLKPISTNHMYGRMGKRTFLTKEGKEYKRDLGVRAKKQENLGNADIFMEICYYFPDRRRRDVTNYDKVVLDALSGITYEDDKQISEIILRKYIDKHNPRTEVRLWRK